MTPLAPVATGFLREHLPRALGRSRHTCESYAHAFRLWFVFAAERHGLQPSQLCLEHLDAALVLDFLAHIEHRRGNTAATRNARLTAIKAFMRYVELRVPAALEQVRQVHAIPAKRHDQMLVRHLTMEEVRAVLNAPDPSTRLGIRDRAMLHLCFAAGLRVSELVALPLAQVCLQGTPSIRVYGKGRRERCLPLWKETAADLRAWLAVRGEVRCPELFANAEGTAMTRAGFEYVLDKHVRAAAAPCPALAGRSVTPTSSGTVAPWLCSRQHATSARWPSGSATPTSGPRRPTCAWIRRRSWKPSKRCCHQHYAADASRPLTRSSPHCSAQQPRLPPGGRRRAKRHAQAPHHSPALCGAPRPRIRPGSQGKAMPLRIIARST
jgi:site-specific recombinase XerD